MFTGIVEEIGKIVSVRQANPDYTLQIEAEIVLQDVHLGDSIAVNGVCLTVTAFRGNRFTVDLAPETRKRSNLAFLKPGSVVNLERALLPTTRLGGHFVQGHVDGLAAVRAFKKEQNSIWVTLESRASFMRYVVEKGFISLDGASLTVVETTDKIFTVTLVPFSREQIILSRQKTGYLANVEVDIIGKYVEKLFKPNELKKNMTPHFLIENGFL